MEYQLIHGDMQPKLIFPAEDDKWQISQDMANNILRELTKHQFTLSEVRGLLARIYDVAILGAKVDFTCQKED